VLSTYLRRHELVDPTLLEDESVGRPKDEPREGGDELRPPVAPPAEPA
jgi:hypothetical protein